MPKQWRESNAVVKSWKEFLNESLEPLCMRFNQQAQRELIIVAGKCRKFNVSLLTRCGSYKRNQILLVVVGGILEFHLKDATIEGGIQDTYSEFHFNITTYGNCETTSPCITQPRQLYLSHVFKYTSCVVI